ncbi:MAG TPA: protein translocase subunit SecF [Candidatus Nanoarchaeia archaeon]|nr:protein translocase subunit SecF [Candidatus Nanoarchaeia archaeon]
MESHNKENNAGKKASLKESIYNFYDKKYKILLIIPFLVLFLSFAQIAYQYQTTGDFIKKDVSLKGGVTITIPYTKDVNLDSVEEQISSNFPQNDLEIRSLSSAGKSVGIIIDADINGNDKASVQKLLDSIESSLSIDLENTDYGLEIIGSSLGNSFFRESLIALAIAFFFMGVVVLIYFRSFIPSLAVILACFSDMVVTLAIINLLGVKIGTAGIAAFLMLIGYSVDTDILLTIRVLKRKEGTIMERIISSVKTGTMMTLTAVCAVSVSLIFSQSDVIKQIMLIVLVGLVADLIFTWIQNVGLLRIYAERKLKKGITI